MGEDETPTIAIVGDCHVGSTGALWPEGATVEGGGEYTPNLAQQFLNRRWRIALAELAELKPHIIVVNGDAIQGSDRKDNALVTNNLAAQIEAAYELLAPLRDCCQKLYCIRGTEFHDGRAAQHAEMLAARLGAEQDQYTHQYSRWELWLRFGPGVVQIKHAVGSTQLPWGEATAPLRVLMGLRLELLNKYGHQAPDLRCIVRNHRHRMIHVEKDSLHAITVTGWQLQTPYSAAKVDTLPEVGYAVLRAEDEGIRVRLRRFEPPPIGVEE